MAVGASTTSSCTQPNAGKSRVNVPDSVRSLKFRFFLTTLKVAPSTCLDIRIGPNWQQDPLCIDSKLL